MNKLVLIDGNNLLFRSYYATAYSGNLMKNSKGFPTNGLYGFVNMINKIVKEEKPTHLLVAFDKGKTFRHAKYDFYKKGRSETPSELLEQFPVAKEILVAMGIKYFEIDNYEADDIIGTLSLNASNISSFETIIVSSDKDLLQLINDSVLVKLLKSKDFIRMDRKRFVEEYGIEPIYMIDLKSLSGDPSDNIPGVKGIGEKTALKLLSEYNDLEGIYKNIDNIKGKLKEKLINDKDNAFISYELATIYKEVPLDFSMEDILFENKFSNELIDIYEELEFYSFLKKIDRKVEKINFSVVSDISDIKIKGECAIYLEMDSYNYHTANIIGLGVYNHSSSYYIPRDVLLKSPSFLKENLKYTYDLKKIITVFRINNIEYDNFKDDILLMGYLLNYNVKDDIAVLANNMGYNIPFLDKFFKNKEINESDIASFCVSKAKFIFENRNNLYNKIKDEGVLNLYQNMELPLSYVLSDMEFTGINIDIDYLKSMKQEINDKLNELRSEIYSLAGIEFNILSFKQLGDVLFEKLELPHGKKTKTGYSTNKDVLNKLISYHPIVEKIIEYRTLSKLYSTYIEGLIDNSINNKIHTIYTQTLTRTGRLSSVLPNLQNIPVRYSYGKLIRKAFKPSLNSVILTSDYSQIELRILAHMSNATNMIDAFKNNIDIHTKTASDIFKVPIESVTNKMRSNAKAVNFGIVYGISSFGLSEDIGINIKEAEVFINNYLESFPGIKIYMDEVIKEAYEKGYVKTLMNRKRIIDEIHNKNYMIKKQGERIALNTPIQGTSADILKKAMIEIFNEFNKRNLKSKMLLQVHDELIFDCLKSELDEVSEIVVDIMENTYSLNVPLLADLNIGCNWYDAK